MMEDIKYEKIIDIICKYKKIDRGEIFKILKNRECKYLFLLLLKKYKCIDVETINNYFPNYSKKALNYGFKKAEEKFFVNRDFRETYFEIEDDIEKSL
ncbi:hypothetical protein SAMN02745134_03776 [Clostridium acidisoli DSM 12555]|uniref:Uncharacterized protein n=1 Tax=Clostridium acidisoli DSM 12555 TaxID=1121291 RepID=A0A1W1XYM7_9CLOT|nr:ribose-5-phosphate isomerase [Clostridium acidisoli]SMC29070.1 hypothetical protein SAMN02745134_03776 [Clostridium acidisoli DSM 12555]